jgi:type I restriction enzyme, S subunit
MSESIKLPESWTKTTFGQIASIEMGQSPESRFYNNEGVGLPFFQGKTEFGTRFPEIRKWCSVPGKIAEAGDILLSIRAPVGPTNIAQARSCIGRGLAAIRAEDSVNQLYLFYHFRHIESWLSDQGTGTTFAAISGQFLKQIECVLAPAAEQNRIVEKLEELLSDLDSGVAELIAAQKKLVQYRQSLLQAMVEGALTAEWRAKNTVNETGAELLERSLTKRRAHWEAKQLAKYKEQGKAPPTGWQNKYPEPVEPDTTDLPTLPKGWVWASLDMLGEIASGVAKGSKRDANIPVREVPYLRVANVQRGYLEFGEIKTILANERDIKELTLQNGDVLFNEGGDRDKLGRGWVWRDEVANCIHQNHVFRMRPYLRETLPELVSHHGNTFGKKWFQSAGKQTTNLASINMGNLRGFPVPVAPADEQQEILSQLVQQIDALNDQENSVALGLKQSEAQRKNILKAAFSGRLVPQYPFDEPASVILERIRAERAGREKKPKLYKTKIKKEISAMINKLKVVLAEASDWMSAQEAFRLCGVADGTQTDQIEVLYAELRELDKAKQLAVEPVTDSQGRKLYDRIKLVATA